jgi:hypothetical protein
MKDFAAFGKLPLCGWNCAEENGKAEQYQVLK